VYGLRTAAARGAGAYGPAATWDPIVEREREGESGVVNSWAHPEI
jgi:hypothetical protein